MSQGIDAEFQRNEVFLTEDLPGRLARYQRGTMAFMRLPRVSILLCACASLLAVQIGGLHVHGHADGHAGDRGGAHLHFHGLHEHGNHSDVHHSDSPAGGQVADRQPPGSNGVAVAELSSGNWKSPDLDADLHHGPCLEDAGAVGSTNRSPNSSRRQSGSNGGSPRAGHLHEPFNGRNFRLRAASTAVEGDAHGTRIPGVPLVRDPVLTLGDFFDV